MKLRYLCVDRDNQLVLMRRSMVRELWKGRLWAGELGDLAENEMRLVSVLCNVRLVPMKIFLMRLPLTDGYFTRRNYRTLQVFTMPNCVTPREVVQHHIAGWPRDFFPQMAVALDVPRSFLDVPMGIGGPLMTAAAMRVSPGQALRYLK